MLLSRNQVYARTTPEGHQEVRLLRVLASEVRFIDVQDRAATWSSITIAQCEAERWKEAEDPWASLRAVGDDDLSPYQLQIRSRRRAALRALFTKARELGQENHQDHEDFLFIHAWRIKLCRKIGEQCHVAPSVLYRWLKDWWRRGMCRNACLPDVDSMSGKGKSRAVPAAACDSSGWPLDPNRYRAIGRSPGIHGIRGIRMTEPIRCSILTDGKRLYKDNPNLAINDAYLLWKDQCGLPASRTPSPYNFYDVLITDAEIKELISQRHLVGRKPRQKPPIRERTSTRVPGPCFRYQIDATPTPIRLLNEATGEIGPCATLYWALDTYVQGIAGYEISAETERALGAQIAFYNATLRKDTFCAPYKAIDIAQWPMWGVPEQVVYDRRLIGPVFDVLLEVFGTDIDNTPAYSPQLRADVEAAFGSFLRKVLTKLDAYLKPRAGRKYDAGTFPPLTISEFHLLVILFVLEYNSRELDRLPTPSDIANSVLNTPTARWNAEVDRRKGARTAISEEDGLIAFTIGGKARITRRGIELPDGLTYRCPVSEMESFQRRLGDRSRRILIRYSEAHTHRIFVQIKALQKAGMDVKTDRPHKFVSCELHPDCKDWAGYSFPNYRSAQAAYNEKMREARDQNHIAGAARVKAVTCPKEHTKIDTKFGPGPETTAQLVQAAADTRILGGEAAPTPLQPAPLSQDGNVGTVTPAPTPLIAPRNLSALRKARMTTVTV